MLSRVLQVRERSCLDAKYTIVFIMYFNLLFWILFNLHVFYITFKLLHLNYLICFFEHIFNPLYLEVMKI